MAASVAAKLNKECDVEIETIRGGLGEFSVSINDQKTIVTSRLWYPNPFKVIRQIRAMLNE
jgi:hypothetical protein